LSLGKIGSIVTLAGGIAVACAILSGCGVQGDEYQPKAPPAEKSLIYLYRPYKTLGTGATPMVTCGRETIEMEPGGFYGFENESGAITCSAAGEARSELKFDAHPGERYFVREDVEGGTHFTLMSASAGSEEIKECRRQGIKQ
jgi:hypothetical protein